MINERIMMAVRTMMMMIMMMRIMMMRIMMMRRMMMEIMMMMVMMVMIIYAQDDREQVVPLRNKHRTRILCDMHHA